MPGERAGVADTQPNIIFFFLKKKVTLSKYLPETTQSFSFLMFQLWFLIVKLPKNGILTELPN